MAETTETKKQTETPAKDEGELYLFPREGVTIKAASLEEAQKLYNKTLNKESDNG